MKNSVSIAASESAWSAARLRLDEYLCALPFINTEQRGRITLRLLERAARKHAEQPSACPTALVIEEIRAALDRCLKQNLASRDWGAVPRFAAWFDLDAPGQCPVAVLTEETPADFQCELSAGKVRAIPAMRISRMVPQPFANPLRGVIHLGVPIINSARDLSSALARPAAAVLSVLSILLGARWR